MWKSSVERKKRKRVGEAKVEKWKKEGVKQKKAEEVRAEMRGGGGWSESR